MHRRIDQLVRLESGSARVTLGAMQERVDESYELEKRSTDFIPEGTWHNIINTGSGLLKLQLVHSPAKRWRDDVYHTRDEAMQADREMEREVTMGMAGAAGFGA